MRIRTTLLFIVVFLLAGSVAFAQSKRRTEFDEGPAMGVSAIAHCGDFDVWWEWTGWRRLMVREDENGVEVQRVQHLFIAESRFINGMYPDMSLEGSAEHSNCRVTEGIYYCSGIFQRVNVKGKGLLFTVSGHYAYDTNAGEYLFFHGPNDRLEGDTEALCDALRP